MRRHPLARLVPAQSSLAALCLLVVPATAQLGTGPSGMERIFDLPGERGQGSGTWIEPGTQAGAAFGELYSADGTIRYLLEANVLGTSGGDQELEELFPFGILQGELHAYRLYIVPTEPEVVATVAGQWLSVGPDGGIFDAVLYGTDLQTGAPIGIGAISGTYELPFEYAGGSYPYYNPLTFDAVSAPQVSGGAQQVGSGSELPYLEPVSPNTGLGREASGEELGDFGDPIGWEPPFLLSTDSSASGMGSGQEATGEGLDNFGDPLPWSPPFLIPPYPAERLEGDGAAFGDGLSGAQGTQATGMELLTEGQAQSGSGGGQQGSQGRQGTLSFQWIITD